MVSYSEDGFNRDFQGSFNNMEFIFTSLLFNVCFQNIHASMHPIIYPSIYPSFQSFIHPSIHSSIHPSIHPFIHSSIHPSIHHTNKSFTQPNDPCIHLPSFHVNHIPTSPWIFVLVLVFVLDLITWFRVWISLIHSSTCSLVNPTVPNDLSLWPPCIHPLVRPFYSPKLVPTFGGLALWSIKHSKRTWTFLKSLNWFLALTPRRWSFQFPCRLSITPPPLRPSIHLSTPRHMSVPFIGHPLIHPPIRPKPPASPPTHPSVRPSTCSSIYPSTSIHPPAHPSTCPSIHLLIHLSIYPLIHPSIHPSIHLPIHSSAHPSVHPSIRPSIHPPAHPSIRPSMRSPIASTVPLLLSISREPTGETTLQQRSAFTASTHPTAIWRRTATTMTTLPLQLPLQLPPTTRGERLSDRVEVRRATPEGPLRRNHCSHHSRTSSTEPSLTLATTASSRRLPLPVVTASRATKTWRLSLFYRLGWSRPEG